MHNVQEWGYEPIHRWLSSHTQDKTFADIGGLWFTVHETVTIAAKANAKELTMIDRLPMDNKWWSAFHERCKNKGVSNYQCHQANLDNDDILKLGPFDVIFCSGILYHCPNPIHTLSQLGKLCNETLVLGTHVIDHKMSTELGVVEIPRAAALYVPSLNEKQIAILNCWMGKRVLGYKNDKWTLGEDAHIPFWWLFPEEVLRSWLSLAGFTVKETSRGHDYYFMLCQKTKQSNMMV